MATGGTPTTKRKPPIGEVLLHPSAHEIRKDLLGAFHQFRVILEEPGHSPSGCSKSTGQGSQGSHIFIYLYRHFIQFHIILDFIS